MHCGGPALLIEPLTDDPFMRLVHEYLSQFPGDEWPNRLGELTMFLRLRFPDTMEAA
jgi:hypothetical protein